MSTNARILKSLADAGIAVQTRDEPSVQGAVVRFAGFRRWFRLYSWQVTDNGAATGVERRQDERRIQAIGSPMQRIQTGHGAEPLVLGWSDKFSRRPVIVAFNPYGVAHRVNRKINAKIKARARQPRASDSQQFRQGLIDEAASKGVALGQNQHGEFVIAFRPKNLPQYIKELKRRYHSRSIARKAGSQFTQMEDLVAKAEQRNSRQNTKAPQEPKFDLSKLKDERERLAREIAVRRGQAKFRTKLIETYSCCAISGCTLKAVLEAAHIVPYRGPGSNHVSNGLLLRGDIHTLFDLGLLAIDNNRLTVLVSPRLVGTEYNQFKGRRLNLGRNLHRPSSEALAIHRASSSLSLRSKSRLPSKKPKPR